MISLQSYASSEAAVYIHGCPVMRRFRLNLLDFVNHCCSCSVRVRFLPYMVKYKLVAMTIDNSSNKDAAAKK